MSAGTKTGIYAGAAGLLVLLAIVTAPGIGRSERFTEEGEPFFPGFTDPAQARSLEVYRVDEQSASANVFKVERKDGVWTIPSHHGYPADAEDRMAKAAALLIGLEKGAVRSDSRADHAALGVVDPRDAKADLEGRGLLVAFRGENGEDLGQLILGNEVEGREGLRFVRVPEKRRTYVAKVKADLSTRFADWVETDLLKLGKWEIEQLAWDNYSVDEQAGVVRPGEEIVGRKADDDWTIEGQAEDEEPNVDELDAATEALDDMKIVGVRPKPEGLTERLETGDQVDRMMMAQSLKSRGYFLARGGKLYSNEGDLLVTTKDGVRYTLRFGEIVYGTAEEVSAGSDGDGDEDGDGGEKEGRPNRYLMVTVEFDPDWFERPEGEAIGTEEVSRIRQAIREIEEIVEKVEAAAGGKDEGEEDAPQPEYPETLAEVIGDEERLAKDPWENEYVYERTEDGFRVTSLGLDGAEGGEGAAADLVSGDLDVARDRMETASEIRAYEDKVKRGRETAAELGRRFAPWYYVIDADLYDKLKLSRADLVKKKEKPEDGGDDGPGDDDGGEETTPDTPGGDDDK